MVVQFGHGDPGRPGRDHRGRLDGYVPGRLPRPAARVAEQDEVVLCLAGSVDLDAPAFPARAAGQRPDLRDLDGRAPQRLQPRGEDAGQLGHDPQTRPRCGGGTRCGQRHRDDTDAGPPGERGPHGGRAAERHGVDRHERAAGVAKKNIRKNMAELAASGRVEQRPRPRRRCGRSARPASGRGGRGGWPGR